MKQGSTLFLKLVILLIAIGAFVWMLWFPQLEGRAANLDLVGIYTDPFIIYSYIASIPFFVALYLAFTLLGLVDKDKIFSQASVRTISHIKYCLFAVVGFLVMAIFYIRVFVQGEDSAGPTMMGLIAIFASIAIATAAGVFQTLLQNAVDMKSENDLTV